jgi:SNF2 family DNA or RNA helicase
LTLLAASRVVYFSCRYNLETRLQSEDRAHRKGQTRTVIYTDIVGEGTIDEDIAANLQAKTLVARRVLPPPAEYQR